MSEDIEKSCPLHPENSVFDCEKGRLGHKPCHFYNPNTRQCVIFDISENLKDIPQALSFLSLELRQPKYPQVEYNNPLEFIEEIKIDKKEILRGIVRCDIEYSLSNSIIRCSYIVNDQVIRLEIANMDPIEAGAMMQMIMDACLDSLLDFRHGRLKLD